MYACYVCVSVAYTVKEYYTWICLRKFKGFYKQYIQNTTDDEDVCGCSYLPVDFVAR